MLPNALLVEVVLDSESTFLVRFHVESVQQSVDDRGEDDAGDRDQRQTAIERVEAGE